jgi:ribose-phosphate pyrophosphokinase
MSKLDNIVLLSGNSNKLLSEKISSHLNINLCNRKISKFSNTEIKINICENIRNKDVFIIQTGTNDINNSINDYIMETLLLIDACKRSMANSINLIMPCYPYARQDKKENSREPISAKLFANMLTVAGITRLIVMDLHASQIQGFFDIPVDNIYSLQLVIQYVNKNLFNNMSILEKQQKYIVVSPDAGATKRTLKFAEYMQLNTIIMHKQRNYEKENVIDNTILIGDTTNLKNKTAIICDDMCDSGGTLIKVIDNLKKNEIKNVIVIITHGIFSGQCIKRLQECNVISKIIVSDTICQKQNIEVLDKLEVFSISELLANVISNIINGNSLSLLFE